MRTRKRKQASTNTPETNMKPMTKLKTTTTTTLLAILGAAMIANEFLVFSEATTTNSGIRFSPESNAYSGLTFTFDPRLDKRVEWLHFEHWLSIMHQSSELLHESLNGRAHLAEVRVLIPYKWRNVQWPVLNKPGAPIIMNRRLRYTDSDVIVGFEDPTYKESPFAVQHDECARQGLHISMPISFLEENNNEKQSNDPRLKARLLVREFASHRFGLFKESGFRNDLMYPPFASLAGLTLTGNSKRPSLLANRTTGQLSGDQRAGPDWPATDYALRGFDSDWNECSFDTQVQNGLPSQQSSSCLPYLTRMSPAAAAAADKSAAAAAGQSFNLMSADPFSHADLSARFTAAPAQQQQRPVEWRDLADSIKWHFCGDNFAQSLQRLSNDPTNRQESFAHNQLANNKQNVLCQERSAMEIIKASEDFKRPTFSPSTFNRLPAPNFSFLQEMPPRVILCVEYAAHLFQSRRLDHGILEAAIGKFLAYDLMADSEIALVLFGQRNSSRQSFERLDSSIKSRLTLYNPAIDPFDEPVRYYTEQELSQIFGTSSSAGSSTINGGQDHASTSKQQPHKQPNKIVKGTCSFAKLMHEVAALQQQRSHQYDDIGADIVIISSGLFIEDETKIEEIVRAQFRPDSHQINLIIYPSTMLFDTNSMGYAVLDPLDSEAIVKNRMEKLLLLKRLTNANIHLIKEHLDPIGDVKMSTLIQFYQIFDHIAKGHSWDQQQSMMLLAHESVPSPPSISSNRLNFQFHVDASVQNELIVAFIDPKQHSRVLKPGNRFILRNLELRSPGGQLVLTDSHPWPMAVQTLNHHHQSLSAAADSGESASSELTQEARASQDDPQDLQQQQQQQQQQHPLGGSSNTESALFQFRTQLGLAGFHLKPAHLALLLNTTSGGPGNKISGLWTLSATSDEALQTSAIAMARVNPAGDTITSNCWIQTYYENPSGDTDTLDSSSSSFSSFAADQSASSRESALKTVKVFAQTRGPAGAGAIQEVQARLEVQDEMGNIVQNVNMLDDGLGAPDITRGDGIHSQYVQRAYRPGFYKVSVEMTGSGGGKTTPPRASSKSAAGLGQDSTCCGSFVPPSVAAEPSTRHLSRQLYCGTFYVESNNRLGQQRPPRVNNLTIVQVDQEQRQVTLRWFEPSTDISSPSSASSGGKSIRFARSALRGRKRSSQEDNTEADLATGESSLQSVRNNNPNRASSNQQLLEPGNRYEIKLFTDRDILKRSFDGKPEVGYKFSELNVLDGSFPNASSYGGMKEVTLHLPNGREGIYYIAMRVYNNLGIGSQVSNIVQLWIRTNLTEQEELESIYGQSVTVDANGNVYDKNGELIGQRGFAASSSSGGSNGLLRVGTSSTLEGFGLLLFIIACAFLCLILSVWVFACFVSSARRALATKQDPNGHDDDNNNHNHNKSSGKQSKGGGGGNSNKKRNKKRILGGSTAILANGGSGSSSMVSSTSQCEASSRSSGHGDSLGTGSVGDGSQQDINKLSLAADEAAEHLSYSQLRHQHQLQQQQADHIKQAYLQQRPQYSSGAIDSSNNSNNWHTIVNGYAYATVASPHPQQQQQQQYCHDDLPGDLNQNGLGQHPTCQESGWPSNGNDILGLTSHYDKLKQDASPAPRHQQRVELIDGLGKQSSLQNLMNGLPQVADEYEQSSYLVRSQHQHQQMPSYYNQQLQQQLSSVLKSKQQQQQHSNQDEDTCDSSPALEGVAQEGHEANYQEHGLSSYLGSAGATQLPPPPTQYIYQCAEASIHRQASLAGGADPSIYSQATRLQQVSPGDTGYYANSGHHHGTQYAPISSAAIYGSDANNDPYNQPQQLGLPEGSNCLEESYNNPNSAISEV